jgi:hypothetical protein
MDDAALARRVWEAWVEALQVHDGSFEQFINPQVGDLVLEITDGAQALQAGTFLPTSFGTLMTELEDGHTSAEVVAIIESADGLRHEWTRGQFIRVPEHLGR